MSTSKILKVNEVADYSRYVGAPVIHPLVNVIDYANLPPIRHSLNNYGIYGIFFHDEADIGLSYGCGKYDYKEGTVICVAPGQVGGKEDNGDTIKLTGWALLFHPDLLRGTHLGKTIKDYSFFDYRVNEALHMATEEHDILVTLMKQLRAEILCKRDSLRDTIIVGYIELILNYCRRFYNRQFLTRTLVNTDTLKRLDSLLRKYFYDNLQLSLGLPTVQYCADALCMSANYLGDLVKKSTGVSAGGYIRQYIVREVKNRLSAGVGVAQVAYDLGFDYPQHLSRMFKRVTGLTPTEYCKGL